MKNTQNKWRLRIFYWVGQEIRETFAVGKTKKQTLDRWFLQFYSGDVPSGACIPRDAISVEWSPYGDGNWTPAMLSRGEQLKQFHRAVTNLYS